MTQNADPSLAALLDARGANTAASIAQVAAVAARETFLDDHFVANVINSALWNVGSSTWSVVDGAVGIVRGSAVGPAGQSFNSHVRFASRGVNTVMRTTVLFDDTLDGINFAEIGLDRIVGTDAFGPDFLVNFPAPSPNWLVQVWNDGDELLANGFDTGVPVTPGTFQLLESRELPDRIEFRIDNVLVYTQFEKLPTLTEVRGIQIGFAANNTFTRVMDVDRVFVYGFTEDALAEADAIAVARLEQILVQA
jgi:hypothetical protein